MGVSLSEQAQFLVTGLANQCSTHNGFGSMSPSIYDTAWLAMVQKSNGKEVKWRFPECFDFIVRQQLPSGGWESYATSADGILNTAAALMALKKHLKSCPENTDLSERSTRAEKALNKMLGSLDVETVDQVGFEILIVQHLELLKDEGISLEARSFEGLKKARQEKLSKLPPKSVHSAPSTIYHSLEALIGHIDFDQVARWRQPDGSMMGSPSSTAAYLIHTTSWDDAAETYLENVLKHGSGRGNWSVPSAWPSSLFETSWTVATLLESAINIDAESAKAIGTYLQQALERGGGKVGFAPGTLPDADDTAKTIVALCDLGYSPSVDGLLEAFETRGHFITYPNERNASFTTNCHVLISLLKIGDSSFYISQIRKAVIYLTSRAFAGDWRDKWNRSEYYPMMLLMKAYELLYRKPTLAKELFSSSSDLEDQIPIITLDCTRKILTQQESSGAWGGDTCEITSYAILTLVSLLRLPWVQQVQVTSVVAAITRARSFLLFHRDLWACGRHIWVEKVHYACDMLSEAYCLAATLMSIDEEPSEDLGTADSPFGVPKGILGQIQEVGSLIFRTPLMASVSEARQSIAKVQAGYYFRLLQRNPVSIFPEVSNRKASYQVIIPLAFTACMVVSDHESLDLQLLLEMMVLSNLNFLVDEYMENSIGKDPDDYRASRILIENLFVKNGSSKEPQGMNGNPYTVAAEEVPKQVPQGRESSQQDLSSNITTILPQFVEYVLDHAAVQSSPDCYRNRLAFELRGFLLAHVTQGEDNFNLTRQYSPRANKQTTNGAIDRDVDGRAQPHNGVSQLKQYKRFHRTFYNWVRSTSADHTSCPFSFIFFNSLLYSTTIHSKQNLFGRSQTAYVAEDLCRHLSSLCRMYNDYGSLQRDANEKNLNSINFPEFSSLGSNRTGYDDLPRAKSELLWIAEYERRGVETSLNVLGKELTDDNQQHVIDGLRFFINITDLFGQIYVLKDVGLRNE
ncbi:hypothetical protein F5Y01DRAFT_268144 [Xylaria sp. FL0043]|nr:hypothetical protein F5Y01DRAFT_268144 [Xylaria sp. FL0043]